MAQIRNAFILSSMLLISSQAMAQSASGKAPKASTDVLLRNCNAGNGASCLALAQRYEAGRGVKRNADKAAFYNAVACKSGVIRGCQIILSLHAQGRGTRGPVLRVASSGIACSQGDQAACAKKSSTSLVLEENVETSISTGPSLPVNQLPRPSHAARAVTPAAPVLSSSYAQYNRTIRCLTLTEIKLSAVGASGKALVTEIRKKLVDDLNTYKDSLQKSKEDVLRDIEIHVVTNFDNLSMQYKTVSGRAEIDSELAGCRQ